MKLQFERKNGCWLWQGALDPDGYGRVTITAPDGWSATTGAHRNAYETMVGPIPDGLVLDHLCRNRACINPDHLEPVTNRVNILRGEGAAAQNARKTHCKRGHPFDEKNTGKAKGGRYCKTCQVLRQRVAFRRLTKQGRLSFGTF